MSQYLSIILKELKNGLAPQEIINNHKIPRSTFYRYLRLLRNNGYVYKSDDGKYYLESKKEINRLKKELEELKSRKTNYWKRVWNVIEKDRYKTTEQILLDAEVITPFDSYLHKQAEINHFEEQLKETYEIAEYKGIESSLNYLQYKEGKGWRKSY